VDIIVVFHWRWNAKYSSTWKCQFNINSSGEWAEEFMQCLAINFSKRWNEIYLKFSENKERYDLLLYLHICLFELTFDYVFVWDNSSIKLKSRPNKTLKYRNYSKIGLNL
jgi:hypothetical protein